MNYVEFHLTARPWSPLETPRDAYLDVIEGVVRFTSRHQNGGGAIIDPFLNREHQYATPYYAHALGTLLQEGRALDLIASGERAMDWATSSFETNNTDGHRVFYIAALVQSLDIYSLLVPAETLETWRRRLKTPVLRTEAYDHNWTTYAMKGNWLRAQAGLIDRKSAIEEIEYLWRATQQVRIADTPGNLYHDTSSDPDTLAVEPVGRGNLLAMVLAGYDGPSADQILHAVASGTRTALHLQEPSGQGPCNGRTDNHVWGDVGYLLAFAAMAESARAQGDLYSAGQFRRAARLVFRNLDRWRRTDGEWAGSYYVTKNRFDPAFRVGHQNASQYTNYNGSLMFHLAEAFHARQTEIIEVPAPAEIGGYAFALDESFSSAFANAGGMQMQVNLRGDTNLVLAPDYWTALGVVRFGRVNWDTRLGPGDGARNGATGLGVSFAPTFREDGEWIRLASVPERYSGAFSVQFTHPLLVRCAVDYAPREGHAGSTFRHEFNITPDGVLCTLTCNAEIGQWGVTLPLLVNDGAALEVAIGEDEGIASTRFTGGSEEQNFIVLGAEATLTPEPSVRGAYGDLIPVRAATGGEALHVFVYPRDVSDHSAEAVRDSFRITQTGFESVLGRVEGETYSGRTSAGGVGHRFHLQDTGRADVEFGETCGVVMQLSDGTITSIEVDRDVDASIHNKPYKIKAHAPLLIETARH